MFCYYLEDLPLRVVIIFWLQKFGWCCFYLFDCYLDDCFLSEGYRLIIVLFFYFHEVALCLDRSSNGMLLSILFKSIVIMSLSDQALCIIILLAICSSNSHWTEFNSKTSKALVDSSRHHTRIWAFEATLLLYFVVGHAFWQDL